MLRGQEAMHVPLGAVAFAHRSDAKLLSLLIMLADNDWMVEKPCCSVQHWPIKAHFVIVNIDLGWVKLSGY